MPIGGVSSGLDTYSLIQDIMKVERMPIERMELRQKIINKQKEIYSDVQGRIRNLESRAAALSHRANFDVFKTAYSQPSVVSFSTASNAQSGSYSVAVNHIARAHTIGSDRQDDIHQALGLAEGTISINGAQVSINGDDSLASIRDKINSTEDTGITATIVDHVLRLQMDQTGASQIDIQDGEGIAESLGLLDGESIKHEFVAASDASFFIDGQHISSSVNSISGLIDGVTVNLLGEGESQATISRDVDAVVGHIKNFVNQYNSTVNFLYDQVTERKIIPPRSDADRLVGTLSGDGTLSRIRFRLSGLVSGPVADVQTFNSLAAVGINRAAFGGTQGDNRGTIVGTLEIDEAALRDALDHDFEQVKDLFTKNRGEEGLPEADYGIAVRMGNYLRTVTSTSDGVIRHKNSSFDAEIRILDRQIESMENRLQLREASITKQFIGMERALETMDAQMAWLQSYMNIL